VQLAVIFTAGFALIAWVNLFITDRLAPLVLPNTPEDRAVLRVQEVIGKRRGLLRAGVSIFLGCDECLIRSRLNFTFSFYILKRL
jgi:uncharacterized membrane protein (UPF0182 family)